MKNRIKHFTGRLRQKMHLIIRGHILNPFWVSRERRREIRYQATFRSITEYLYRYADFIKGIKPEPLNQNKEPERAFTIWFQGEDKAPDLVKACFRSMRRNLKQELVILDERNLFDWITLPDYIVKKWKEGKILHTQFSDICRVELLYQHGGLWFDATDFLTTPVPQYIMDEDIFLFMAGKKIRGSYAFIQSCFIRGRKGNPVLGVWREAIFTYWKEENSKIDYFVHHMLLWLCTQVNDIAKYNFEKMPKVDQDPTHILWFEHVEDEYNEKLFNQLTSGSFFQKTNYKDKRIPSLKRGSIGEYLITKL